MIKVHSRDTRLEERRKAEVKEAVSFIVNGEMDTVDKVINKGAFETLELSKPIGEMMTNSTTRKEFLRKVVLDVELGREQVPTLYQPIYDVISDPNMPKEFEAKWAQYGAVIFAEHLEGEEVKFGSLNAEEGPIARIKGYSAGFEYTKEIQMFNQAFNLEILNRAYGEAHNAILNHLHFAPIIKHSYKPKNKTTAVYENELSKVLPSAEGAHIGLSMRATLRKALSDARIEKRPGNILLASEADREAIEEGMGQFYIQATPYSPVSGITDVIYYDGWETTVGKKDYTYDGVKPGEAYLIRPKRGFKELIKQPLQIQSTAGDLTRLVEAQIVGDFWRGVFAAVEENVQKIQLPGY
ncbi:hypothetical protein [Geomicrobium sediminis]|uniref:Aspartate ammonia-lyase n=1 Tax=Geomicrobium sediminis TaxID=1347788 RepID=A0ABS2PER1_9BACL|nr:hypothetical protein [Geomicrobium sediminis]MBM7633836.1 hypothetical protein [Geomicrobium sediminis]